MKRWNDGKPYNQQIRPFGFLLAFMPKTGLFAEPEAVAVDGPKRGRPRTSRDFAGRDTIQTGDHPALKRLLLHQRHVPHKNEQDNQPNCLEGRGHWLTASCVCLACRRTR